MYPWPLPGSPQKFLCVWSAPVAVTVTHSQLSPFPSSRLSVSHPPGSIPAQPGLWLCPIPRQVCVCPEPGLPHFPRWPGWRSMVLCCLPDPTCMFPCPTSLLPRAGAYLNAPARSPPCLESDLPWLWVVCLPESHFCRSWAFAMWPCPSDTPLPFLPSPLFSWVRSLAI